MPTYASMQSAIDDGYLAIASDQCAAVAPVGDAWAKLVALQVPITLWQEDGSHPTEAGTYLAACVFYATVFRQSPVGLGASTARRHSCLGQALTVGVNSPGR